MSGVAGGNRIAVDRTLLFKRYRIGDGRKAYGRLWLRRSALAAGVAVLVAAVGAHVALYVAMLHLGPLPLDEVEHLLPADEELRDAGPSAAGRLHQRRAALDPSQVDPRYLKMLFTFEDRRFYWHPGIDPVGLARAARDLLQNGRIVTGGSTLTMQVARLIDNRYQRTASVKLQQIVRALQLESQLSKRQILSLYLGLAPFGGRLKGVRAASLQFFGKEPRELTDAEAALLVALPQAPERRRLDRHADAARRARNFVLTTVAAAGVVTPTEAERAKQEPVVATSTQMPPKPVSKPPLTNVAGLFAGLTLGINFVAGPATAAPIEPHPVPHPFLESDQDMMLSIRRRLMGLLPRGADEDDRRGLWMFYAGRSDPMWVTKAGWTDAAQSLIDEIRRADDWGLSATDFMIPQLPIPTPEAPLTEQQLIDAEIGLSMAVLKYARFARGGRIPDPASQLSSYLDRKPPLRRPWLVMTEIAQTTDPDAYLRKLHPQHPQFERLRQLYLLKRAGTVGQRQIALSGKGSKLSPGTINPDIALVRQRLNVPAGDQGADYYDDALAEKVRHFQEKRDISPANGVINTKTRRALNQQPDISEKKLLANMEAWRWMPEDLGEVYVWVNIPEFLMRVVRNGEVIHTERVVTGTTETQTPVFSEDIKTIYFHPRWNVPESIKVREIQPSLARGGGYFYRQGMVLMRNGKPIKPGKVNWSKADIRNYDVYQPSGPGNALGELKFTFPNKHAVYMHDTPSKGLFNSSQRTFSHGCVRVRNPLALAQVLLGIDKQWSPDEVASILKVKGDPQELGVDLNNHIPVHITYFTAEVDDDGDVTTQKDVYRHEKRIDQALQGKWNQIDKGRDHLEQVEIVRRFEEGSSVKRSRSAGPGSARRVARSGGGPRGGGDGGYAMRVSSGNSANDVFRRSFGN